MDVAKFDTVVCGAGVIGLSVARQLARQGKSVVLLERHDVVGSETSSRNSEVIHAGIYYPSQSLKAHLCVRGKHLLYDYVHENNISHAKCGKLIVATQESERERLAQLARQARENGVDDLVRLSKQQVADLEPEVACEEGLLSPSTGVIDSHEFMLSLWADYEAAGGVVAFLSEIERVSTTGHGFDVALKHEPGFVIQCQEFVNSAGLSAVSLAAKVDGLSEEYIPEEIFAKGRYCSYSGAHRFRHHIYPVPSDGGLGVHATVSLDGRVKFGPDVEWYVSPSDHLVTEEIIDDFWCAIKRFWPQVERDRLGPDYAGIRPKLHHQGQPAADFRIDGSDAHQVPGLINLFGIESPGLTASLAIAEHVADQLS